MTHASFWLVIALAGAGTLAVRLLPFLAHGRLATPPALERLLRYVPAASLAALIVPGSLFVASAGRYHVEPARIVAIAVAMVVAFKWRNVMLTLVVGMLTLWAGQALLRAVGA